MSASAQMTREEQIHNAKLFGAIVIGFSAFAIASPVISFSFPGQLGFNPVLRFRWSMYWQMFGAAALLGISNRQRLSRDIAFGAVSAVLMLAIAPESIRVALIKMPISFGGSS